MDERPTKDPEYLSTLERGLKVLRAFDAAHPEMALSDVAAVTGLSPAVARRCLNTLVALGYVAQTGRRFLLRPEVLAFGSAYLQSMNIEQVAAPPLQSLRDQTGDSASLAVRSGRDILYVCHIPTQRRIRLGAGVGTRFPAHATSMGKVLLAYEEPEEIEKFLAEGPLARMTERTVTDPEALLARLDLIADRYYDSALDELDYGIVSVAVPIFDPDDNIVAAINCSTSTTRISQDELVSTRLPLLREAASTIEEELRRWPMLARSLKRG
ncbi:IclR family transcriptional regulator domain-containing protein [Polymorphobacter sp.]|uniref:IclR family transcriptional regulator domain-containing protein n=1 Tax=Polymorphobacter sp. TaxID=1909290 RepID=UPI003F730014